MEVLLEESPLVAVLQKRLGSSLPRDSFSLMYLKMSISSIFWTFSSAGCRVWVGEDGNFFSSITGFLGIVGLDAMLGLGLSLGLELTCNIFSKSSSTLKEKKGSKGFFLFQSSNIIVYDCLSLPITNMEKGHICLVHGSFKCKLLT